MDVAFDRHRAVYGSATSGWLERGIDPDNPNILKWWSPDHDNAIKYCIAKLGWRWLRGTKGVGIGYDLLSVSDEDYIREWISADPLCSQYAWMGVLTSFAGARAQKSGMTKLVPQPRTGPCALCRLDFREDSLHEPWIARLGVERLIFCDPCVAKSIYPAKSARSSTEADVLAYIRHLTEALMRVPTSDFGKGAEDFRGLSDAERTVLLRVLQASPDLDRVKELFGSWLNALVRAGVLEGDVRRTMRGVQCVANDGHVCLSLGEKTIDDLLYSLGIMHEREPNYPVGNYRADFKVGRVFIEYFGLVGDPDYDRKTTSKIALCREYNIPLFSIYPADLANWEALKRQLLEAASIGAQ